MAESIQNRNADRSYIRELQQDKNQRKKELADQQGKEIKQLKTFYAEKNKEIDNETADAINHIKMDQSAAALEDRQTKVENRKAQLEEQRATDQGRAEARSSEVSQYNREGRINSPSEKKSLKSEDAIKNTSTEKTESHQEDSFYKIQDRGSQLDEAHDGYFINAYAPEKEKDDMHVSILNDKAIISGKRKFQNTATDEKKTISTNNFQTYREEFKFDRPVAAQGMTRERDGDFIRFFIPKLEATE